MVREFAFLTRRRHRALAVLASTFLVFASIGVVATNADSFKPYDIAGVPGTGTQSPGHVVLSLSVPSTSNQQLGSIQVSVSAGFSISNLSANGTALSSTQATFQGLNVQPGGSPATIAFDVTAPCGGPNTLIWGFQAQQANQWQSGNTGNYLTLELVTFTDQNIVGNPGKALKQQVTSSYNNAGCTYDVSNWPSSINGGANSETLTISNVMGGTGYPTALSVGVSGPYTITSGTTTASSINFPLTFTNGSATITFTLNAPCYDPSGGTTWTFTATPSAFSLRDLNGATPPSPIFSTLTPNCHLAFIAPTGGGPAVADAEVVGGPDGAAVQTLSAGSPGAGAGVKVGLYDASNNLVTAGSQSVTVDLSGGTGLTGTLSRATSSGIATFGNLGDTTTGMSLRLVAHAAGATDGVSNSFNVLPVLKPCDPSKSTCTVTWPTGNGGENSNITANNPQPGNYFAGGPNPNGLTVSCAFSPFSYADAYDPNVTWYYYAGPTGGIKTVVLTIPKSLVQATTNNGTSFYQICYASPVEFNTGFVTGFDAVSGAESTGGTGAVPIPMAGGPAGNNATSFFSATDNGATWFVGLLAPCSTGNAAPCLVSKAGTGGNRVLTFNTPANDPIYR